MSIQCVEELHDLCEGKTAYIIGSGPSLNDFPISFLECKNTICLNDSVTTISCPSFWLFGDPRFSRYKASKILRNGGANPGSVVMNTKHLKFMDIVPEKKKPPIYWFTNEMSRVENPEDKPDFWTGYRGMLPGRWTIATVALSLAVKLGVKEAVLIGIDLGVVEGEFYANDVPSTPPGRQKSMMGQWVKWIQFGFKRGLWPIEVKTTSPHFLRNCPGTPVEYVDPNEVL